MGYAWCSASSRPPDSRCATSACWPSTSNKQGYRPGLPLALGIAFTQLVCGPLVALGLFTRLAAVPVVLFLLVTNIERWRVGRYFWNQLGLEYTLMWTIGALYVLAHGGGAYSLDRLWGL